MSKGKNLGNKEKKMGAVGKVFVLHGWTYSLDKWKPFIKLMTQNGVSTKLLSILGLTEKSDKVFTLSDYVQWLRKILNKETGKIVLIGHSNGGRIALAFAAKYPQKLSHLVLIDSAGIYHNDLGMNLKRFIFKSLARIGKRISSSENLRALLYKLAREEDYKDASPRLRKTLENLISADLTYELNKITLPTMIVWGKQDKITPLSDGLLMHKSITNSRLLVISNARHSPQFTHPQKVYKQILKFLLE